MEDTVFALILRKLNQYRDDAVASMAGGAAKDYAEYRELVAEARVLNNLIEDVKELESRFIND